MSKNAYIVLMAIRQYSADDSKNSWWSFDLIRM